MAKITSQKVGTILTYIVAFALLMSGSAKVFGVEMMVELLKEKTLWIGLIELFSVALFLFPKTRNLGMLFIASYLGGVIVAEWIHLGGAPLPGVVLATLFYVGNYLRKPAFFGIG